MHIAAHVPNLKYGFPLESGNRTSTRRPLGLATCGIRTDADRLRAE